MPLKFARKSVLGSIALVAGLVGTLIISEPAFAAAATSMTFTTAPSNSTPGTVLATQPTVTLKNSDGTTDTSDTSTVTLTITSATGTSGAVLSGCSAVTTSGVAAFSGCKIDTAGKAYTLTATDSTDSLTATSTSFNILGSPSSLAFSAQPASSAVSAVLTTQPAVQILDSYGDVITTNSSSRVSIAITANTGTSGATLSGCATVTASSGVATFSACSIASAGHSYTLTATDSTDSLSVASATFNIYGTASALSFIIQPAGASAGVPLTTQPEVAVVDAYGSTVLSDTTSVTLSLSSGAALGCLPNPATASSGIAFFLGCTVNQTGSFTLTATDSNASITGTSQPFVVSPGAGRQLVFSTQPANSTATASIVGPPVVTIEDTLGNPVTTDSSAVSLSITPGTGTSNATLTCSPVAANAGVATFSSCSINATGTNYTLTATDSTDGASATSAAFSVAPGSSSVSLTTTPTGHGIADTRSTFTATVTSAPGTGALRGTVSFTSNGKALAGCSNLGISGTAASCSTKYKIPGKYSVVATYAGDTNFANSSATLNYQVDKPTPTAKISGAVSKSKTSLLVVLSGRLGKPTGKVVIKAANKLVCTAVLSSGDASCSVASSSLPSGRHRLSVHYGGSSAYASFDDQLVVTVR